MPNGDSEWDYDSGKIPMVASPEEVLERFKNELKAPIWMIHNSSQLLRGDLSELDRERVPENIQMVAQSMQEVIDMIEQYLDLRKEM